MKAKQSHQQHGLHALKRRLRVRGLAALDQRSATFRRALEWRRELEADPGELTATRRTILDLATMRAILLDHGYRWLIEQLEAKGALGLINTKRRQLYPLAGQLAQLSETQERSMERLGLDRPARAIGESEREVVAAVRRDLRRRALRAPRKAKPAGNGISTSPAAETSAVETVQESSTVTIAQPSPEAATTPTN